MCVCVCVCVRVWVLPCHVLLEKAIVLASLNNKMPHFIALTHDSNVRDD